MNSRHIVAIILALCILFAVLAGSSWVRVLVGVPSGDYLPANYVEAWENILFAIIGALAGYITGKDDQ